MLVPNWTLMDCVFTADAESVAADWKALAARALVPSGLNSPELLAPAMARAGAAQLAVVRDAQGLRMVLPVIRQRWPWPVLSNWMSPVSFAGQPHLDPDLAVPALTAFLRAAGAPVILRSVPVSGPLWEAITAAAGHVAILDRWQRAGLEVSGNYANWFETSFERKRRKEYRRQRARLAEQGAFAAERLQAGEDTGPWVAEFLKLEAASWKGRRGTAINADPAAAEILREACEGLAAAGKLRFWKLSLDGRAIAMLYAIVEGGHAWLGKIAHDEAYARFSPGVLQILQSTEDLFAEGGITHVDSCAIPNHPMIDHLWRDRIEVADVMLAPAAFGAFRFAAFVKAERLRRTARAAATIIFYKLTRRRPS